jgi:hypothetical protein
MSERPYVKTLSLYSRIALVVRGWRLEVALALVIVGLWRLSVRLDGVGLGILVFGAPAILAWRMPRLSGGLATTLRDRATARWFTRVLVACEVISRHGQLSRVIGTERIRGGRALFNQLRGRRHASRS